MMPTTVYICKQHPEAGALSFEGMQAAVSAHPNDASWQLWETAVRWEVIP